MVYQAQSQTLFVESSISKFINNLLILSDRYGHAAIAVPVLTARGTTAVWMSL